MQIQGKIIVALPEQSGVSQKGNAWSRRDYVLETQEQYPKKISFSIMNDKIGQFAQLLFVGAMVAVDFDIDAREYNNRWYNSITAWRVTPVGEAQQPQQQGYATAPGAYPPPPAYPTQASTAAPANPYGNYQRPEPKPVPEGAANDLPF